MPAEPRGHKLPSIPATLGLPSIKVTWPSLTVTLIGHRIEHMKHMLYTVFSIFFKNLQPVVINLCGDEIRGSASGRETLFSLVGRNPKINQQ
jgi:hypothetical protein